MCQIATNLGAESWMNVIYMISATAKKNNAHMYTKFSCSAM
jgi:hypothetical protein